MSCIYFFTASSSSCIWFFTAAKIIAAVNNIDAHMLTRVRQEPEHRIDVRRVTRGAHIEHLYLSKKSFRFSCCCEQFH
jgi:hypothetical protein